MENLAPLSNIPDLKPVRIYLPIKNNNQRYRTQAVYKTLSPPRFELRFQPGILPLENLDLDKNCLINVDFGGPNISMEASIASATSLALEAGTAFSPTSPKNPLKMISFVWRFPFPTRIPKSSNCWPDR